MMKRISNASPLAAAGHKNADVCYAVQVCDATAADSSNKAGYIKYIVTAFVLFLLQTATFAQQRILTLQEAVAAALDKNYDIQLSKNDSAIAALDYSYRNAAFLPTLNLNAGTTWNNNSQKQTLADGSKRDRSGIKSNNINSQLALNWTIFDGLKMFVTKDKLAEIVKLGELQIKQQVVNTVADVMNQYYNIIQLKQQIKAIEEQISLDSIRVQLAQYRLDIGVGIKPDVLQSKIDRNAQLAAKMQQERLIAQSKEQLNQLIGLPALTQYDVTDIIDIKMDIALDDILNTAEKNNPTLLVAQKNIDIANLTLKERRAERFPTVSFNSAYNFNRTNNSTVINQFSPLFNQTRGLNYGFTASIPILNHFNVQRNIKQASLAVNYQKLVYESQQSQTKLSVISAFLAYQQQKRSLQLEEENILLAKENVNIVFETYKLSAATLIQLKTAQQSLQDAYVRLITARYNTKLAETELRRLSGEIVK